MRYHRKIVGNEEVGETEFFLQAFQEIDHLSLDRHIESRDGFVRCMRSRPRASALAIAILWRCPPENSGGRLFAAYRDRPTWTQEFRNALGFVPSVDAEGLRR